MTVKEESPEQSSSSHASMSQMKGLLAKAHSDWMLSEAKTEPGESTSAAQNLRDKGRYPSESNLRYEYERQRGERGYEKERERDRVEREQQERLRAELERRERERSHREAVGEGVGGSRV